MVAESRLEVCHVLASCVISVRTRERNATCKTSVYLSWLMLLNKLFVYFSLIRFSNFSAVSRSFFHRLTDEFKLFGQRVY
jgi:hypothetical protein